VQDYLDFVAAHTRGLSLLDVGTGSGLLPHLAREKGYEVEGTDLSKHVSENVPAKAGFQIHHGTLEEIAFSRQYDIITMLHVLEHTSNPLSTLRRARELSEMTTDTWSWSCLIIKVWIRGSRTFFRASSSRAGHINTWPWDIITTFFRFKSLELLGEKAGLRVYSSRNQTAGLEGESLASSYGTLSTGDLVLDRISET